MTGRTAFEGSGEGATCAFAWCTTDHGAVVHPEDGDHRSAGWGWTGLVRDGAGGGPGTETDVEVGLLRRRDDTRTWIVIDTGTGVSLALSPEAAHILGRRLVEDPDLRAVYGSVD